MRDPVIVNNWFKCELHLQRFIMSPALNSFALPQAFALLSKENRDFTSTIHNSTFSSQSCKIDWWKTMPGIYCTQSDYCWRVQWTSSSIQQHSEFGLISKFSQFPLTLAQTTFKYTNISRNEDRNKDRDKAVYAVKEGAWVGGGIFLRGEPRKIPRRLVWHSTSNRLPI